MEDFQTKLTPTISVREYQDDLFEDIERFCASESSDADKASVNMWSEDWKNDPKTLLYLLYNRQRLVAPRGATFLLYDGDDIIGCSGVYKSDFCDKVALAGVRTWISKTHRNLQLVKNYLLVEHKRWAFENGCSTVALTFNEYNRNLIALFERGLRTGSRTEQHLFAKNFSKVPFLVIIQHVPQWVIFESLDDSDGFDWTQIRHQ